MCQFGQVNDKKFTNKIETNANTLPRVSSRANPVVRSCIPHGQKPLWPTSPLRTTLSTVASSPTGAAIVEATTVEAATATTGAAATSGRITATERAGDVEDGEVADQH